MKLKAKICAGILLLFFFGHLSEISFFPHTHLVDGRIVAHSHPYSGKSNNPGHSHSQSQLQLISLLATMLLAAAFFRFQVVLTACDAGRFVNPGERFVRTAENRDNSLRGPPVSTAVI